MIETKKTQAVRLTQEAKKIIVTTPDKRQITLEIEEAMRFAQELMHVAEQGRKK